ncbi:hypothetical protein NUW58_g140 [Xylaria curta]|uniref:Uncharacterized protein n=1 Tax=Xylaria curta TaxID=42375 RepID=A0ACC1PRH8_9PEZI|nr:hypothetical protein NUW58_g140 [Xylaria curta]
MAQEKSQVLSSLPGFVEGQPVMLHLHDNYELLLWYWATMLADGVPVPSAPLSSDPLQRKQYLEGLSKLLDSPICVARAIDASSLQASGSLVVHTVESLVDMTMALSGDKFTTKDRENIEQDSLAMLMLTSGSTGNAKAVCLSHQNILAALSGKASIRQLPSDKPLLNWIGLDHVASLVEVHLQALFLDVDQIHVQAADVVSSPRLFLDLLSIHQVSRSFAPNFFLAKLVSAIRSDNDKEPQHQWNLSNLTDIVSGGEANDMQTCASLAELLASYGAPQNVLTIGFGMTETCAGAIYNTQCPKSDIANGRLFASLGKCMQGIEMRITQDLDEEAGGIVLQEAGKPGNLEVRGAVVFRGYYRNEKDTTEAFTCDGWFRTGDTGIIDSTGILSLVGRVKDIININGIKVGGAELQTSLETAVGSEVLRLVSFASWASHTEQVAIAYVPKQWPMQTEDMVNINDKLTKVCLRLTRSRPLVFALRDELVLPKSSLGKISRAKMRSLLEGGSFADQIKYHQSGMESHRLKHLSLPITEEETRLLEDFASVLGIRPDNIGVDTPFYDFGITSIDVVRLKRKVDQRLSIDIPIVMLMNSPTVRTLALALDHFGSAYISPPQNGASLAKEYDPVVKFRLAGSKTPLWCIHPGVGEVLIFVGLARHMVDDDRPIFALRARGFDAGQPPFKSIAETVGTYKAAVLKHQPCGPYALAGYSYGGMLAFEIAKSLEKEEGASVQFLASFNLPPNIKTRMRHLNFNVCLLHLSYFLGLVTEEYADLNEEQFREVPDAMAQLMVVADRSRMVELNLNENKLAHWAEITFGLQNMAQEYEPRGKVKGMDVFHAIPLKAAAKSREDWLDNHLRKWGDFSVTEPRFHRVGGAHYTMIGPDHVASFADTLKGALRARGL